MHSLKTEPTIENHHEINSLFSASFIHPHRNLAADADSIATVGFMLNARMTLAKLMKRVVLNNNKIN